MKKHIFSLLALLLAWSVGIASPKPDFITRNEDGSIRTRGVYDIDDAGRVRKFSVYDGAAVLLYTEVPYYAADGRLIRCDTFDASGKLKSVAVMFEGFATILGEDGRFIRIQDGIKKD